MRGRFRLRRRIALLVVAGAFLLGSMPQARGAEPLSLRGFRLGILLADFEVMPAPDQMVWPGAKPLCSDNPEAGRLGALSAEAGVRLSEAEAKAGFVRCGFFYPSEAVLAPAGLIIAGARGSVSFIFVPDREGSMRLAAIQVTAASANYPSVKSALSRKYGRPKLVVRGYAHDARGSTLVDETTRWSNGVSDIRLSQRGEREDIEVMTIEYIHEALAAGALKQLNAIRAGSDDVL